MNKRARMRLIIVTVVIMAAVTGFLVYASTQGGGAAYYKTVAEVVDDPELVGQRIRVAGTVVEGSWDKTTDPMEFEIRAEDDETGTGPVINVVYEGGTPSTFGDGVVAIVTGDLAEDGTIESNDMITKCPSKYESAAGLPAITEVVTGSMSEMTGAKGTGYVVPGSIAAVTEDAPRFVVSGEEGGSETVEIFFDGALPSGMADGSLVVITGQAQEDGTFVATEVALEQSEQ